MEKVMPSSSILLIKLNKAYMMEDGTSKRRGKQKEKTTDMNFLKK